MLEFLQNYSGSIEVNDVPVNRVNIVDVLQKQTGEVTILLTPKHVEEDTPAFPNRILVRVKSYMLHKSTPEFLFMHTWNNDVPMPLRIMQGDIVKESKSMYYVRLRGYGKQLTTCCKCGIDLKNNVLKDIGVCVRCAKTLELDVFKNGEVDVTAIRRARNKLLDTVWSGWIPKSAILTLERLHGNSRMD